MTRRLQAELLDAVGAVVGEGPSWDPRTQELVSVDILSGQVYVHDVDGRLRTTYEIGSHVSSALPAEAGGWLLTTPDGFALLDGDGSVRPLLALEEDKPDIRFNDAKCDPWGQALAGTMRYDEAPGSGTLYRLEATATADNRSELTARVLLERLGLSNGLGWSADGRTMYFVDSLAGTVARHAYSPEGDLGPGHELVSLPRTEGVPDGLCVDVEGSVWVALYGGGAVHRYRPDGRLDTVVQLPVPHPTSVAFGGPDGGRLFITTAGGAGRRHPGGVGGLWAVDPGVGGSPPPLWRHPSPRPPTARGAAHG
jgi:sugar lactone lactonase YvrE